MIRQYLRSPEGHPIGVMVATLINNQIHFGWSVTHSSDTFNKVKGLIIATGRCEKYEPNTSIVVPTVMLYKMEKFIQSAMKHFQIQTLAIAIDGWVLASKRDHPPMKCDLPSKEDRGTLVVKL